MISMKLKKMRLIQDSIRKKVRTVSVIFGLLVVNMVKNILFLFFLALTNSNNIFLYDMYLC